MKTILITGTSSGYGLDTARLFLAKGWNVIATMRVPREDVLPRAANLRVLPLDVTNAESIAKTVADAGPIDVLVNNAGIGALGAFEATPMHTVRELFETNTLGVMAMTQAVVPQMRSRGEGTIINVTSSVTLGQMPLVAAYCASKMATLGFTASLSLELAEFGVTAKIVEPGYGPNTAFTANGGVRMQGLIPESYAPFAQRIFADFAKVSVITTGEDVAQTVYRAATDETGQLRFPAGPDAVALAQSRF